MAIVDRCKRIVASRTFRVSVSVAGILAMLGFLHQRDPERRFQFFKNEYASCANDRSGFKMTLPMYAYEHGGWFPKGGTTPLQTLETWVRSSDDPWIEVGNLSSHALSLEAEAIWLNSGVLSPEHTIYKYNEGLRNDDPANLILMYFKYPTHWECREHKRGFLGRPVLNVGSSWQFLKEGEFQQLQKETADYLDKRRETSLREAEALQNLLCVFHTHESPDDGRGIILFMQSEGAPIDVTVVQIELSIIGEDFEMWYLSELDSPFRETSLLQKSDFLTISIDSMFTDEDISGNLKGGAEVAFDSNGSRTVAGFSPNNYDSINASYRLVCLVNSIGSSRKEDCIRIEFIETVSL